MNATLVKKILRELQKMPILDPHTHVRAGQPVAQHLGDLLGYHYYTELSNSARGRPAPLPDDPEARLAYVWPHLPALRGTIQWDWMMGISEAFLGIPRQDWFSKSRAELVRRAHQALHNKSHAQRVWLRSNIKSVVMTNQFDEDLSRLPDRRLVPALRTDDLLFNVVSTQALARLDKTCGLKSGSGLPAWRKAVSRIFDNFRRWKMAYAAVSLPPDFKARAVPEAAAAALLKRLARSETLDAPARRTWAAFALEELAGQCQRVNAPYCLMLGVDRGVYEQGVPSGQDQFRCDAHLRGYDWLFNRFSGVRFPVLVLSDTAGLELAAAGWIRHNVYPMSHWWYSSNPVDVRRELRRRLDVLPRTKFIGFHSDAYSLEFVLPKFNMYRLQLAIVLAERITESQVGGRAIVEPLDVDGALELAEQILIRNCSAILGCR